MSIKEQRTIELEFNELHQPMVGRLNKAKLRLHVAESPAISEMKEVMISGNPEALRALGTLLLGISESPGYHVHIDEEADKSWFSCSQGFALTVENTQKSPHKKKRTPDELPPDWAR